MRLSQRLLHGWLTFIKYTLNPLTRRLAQASVGPFSIIQHVGRRSGEPYETPIVAQRSDNGFVIELTYGPNVDWYQNVLAAGRGTVVWHGKAYAFARIEPMDVETGMAAFPAWARVILRLARRKDFVKLT